MALSDLAVRQAKATGKKSRSPISTALASMYHPKAGRLGISAITGAANKSAYRSVPIPR